MGKMHGNFNEIISASIEWTKTIFLKPFSFKKWIMLWIIALLAFQLQGGCNLNLSNSPRKETKNTAQTTHVKTDSESGNTAQNIAQPPPNKLKPTQITTIVIIGLVIFLLIIGLTWIASIFSFVFIGAIANNDASIKKAFAENRPLGDSYFLWSIIYLTIFLGIIALLVKLGYDSLSHLGVFVKGSNVPFGKIMLAILPHILIGIFILLASGIFSFIISDYALIIMYGDRIGILKAIKSAFLLFCFDLAASIKYLFIKIGLWIITYILTAVIGLLEVITMVVPVLILGFSLYGFYKVIPPYFRLIYIIFLIVLGIPSVVVMAFLNNLILLPFSIFLKTFNLKFIARLNKRYDLFTPLH